MKALLTHAMLALALTAAGAARADTMTLHGMGKPAVQTPADRAYAASMKTMMANMAVKPTGDPDKDFVSMMMPHHQGAVDMAKVELRYGKDPILLKMAQDIVDSQEKELATMKAWQVAHGH